MSKIKGRAEVRDGVCTVKALISHPMETGQRKDKDGNAIPAHYISDITAEWNGTKVMTAQWSTAVSRDPYLSFMFRGAKAGDSVKLSFVDNKGEKDTTDIPVK